MLPGRRNIFLQGGFLENNRLTIMAFHRHMMAQYWEMVMYYDDIILNEMMARRRRQRRWWTRPWLLRRPLHSFSHTLVEELRAEEPRLYEDLLGVSIPMFDDLMNRVGPRLERMDTRMRDSIPAK